MNFVIVDSSETVVAAIGFDRAKAEGFLIWHAQQRPGEKLTLRPVGAALAEAMVPLPAATITKLD